MELIRLTALLFLLASVLSEASSLLQRGASRQRSFAGFRYSPQDPAARTLLTLDTNHDGRIDPSEVAAFARSQDLDSAAATEEFASIDLNGDGTLDSVELTQVLGPSSPTAGAQVAPVNLRTVTTPADTVKEEPPVASSPLAQHPPVLVAAEPVPEALPAAAVEATATQPEVVAAPAPTEKVELISEESRTSMRMAAQKVTEELDLEESEEREARKSDRKAAEVREKSSALVKQTVQNALDAGSKAAHEKADELMKKIDNLEDQAERAEVRAVALRAKSKMELEEGNQLMAVANQALKESPDI